MPSNQNPLPCYINRIAFSHSLLRGDDETFDAPPIAIFAAHHMMDIIQTEPVLASEK
jgi:hypothetical protein